MNRRAQILFASAVLLGSVACETAWAQEEPQASRTVTEFNSLAGPYNPARVIRTERQDQNRKVETEMVEAPSANGRYEPIRKTEQETIQVDANTVRVVQRWFSPGSQQPFQVSEEERRTEPGGRESVVRTTSTLDLSGRWQIQERDLEETVSTAPDTKQTKKAVLGMVGGSLTPVLHSEQTERRNGNSLEVQRKLLTPDGRGDFQLFEERRSVATQTKDGRTTEEKTYRDDGRGQMMLIEQTVGSEWQQGETRSGKMSQTYSIYVSGTAPDGRLHLVQQRSQSTSTAPGGETRTEEQTQQVNPGSPEGGLRTTGVVSEVAKPLGKLRTATHTEVRGVNQIEANGDLMVIWVTDSQKTREIR